MSKTTTKDLRVKTNKELGSMLLDLKKESFNMRFQQAQKVLTNTNRIRVVRKDIARINTLLREKRDA